MKLKELPRGGGISRLSTTSFKKEFKYKLIANAAGHNFFFFSECSDDGDFPVLIIELLPCSKKNERLALLIDHGFLLLLGHLHLVNGDLVSDNLLLLLLEGVLVLPLSPPPAPPEP